MKYTVPNLECAQCGWRWVPRLPDVRRCPSCGSVRWDAPKKAVPTAHADLPDDWGLSPKEKS